MTCIVGMANLGTVYIGADSAGVGSGWELTVRADTKVFRNGPMLFGFTSSFRMGQLLRYSLTIPEHPSGMDTMQYMTTIFVDAVRQCLKDGGYAKKTNEEESAGTFLAGYQGRLFRVASDYQVEQSVENFMACGCGEQIALGAMFGARGNEVSPEDLLITALEAAETFSAGVRRPFVVEKF